jgi:hypothetical protein
MNRRASRPGIVVAALAMIVAACSGSSATAAPSSPPSSPPAVTSAGPVSAPPVSTVVPSFAIPSFVLPSGGSFAIPSFTLPSEDKDLEARLPNSLNGVTLTKVSFRGDTILGGPASSSTADIRAILAGLGKTPSDFSEAVASDPTGALKVTLGAIRVTGADGGAMLNAFLTASKNTSPDLQVSQANLGGKNVTVVTNPSSSSAGTTYIYASGDTLFFAQTLDAQLAAAALAAMP